VSSLFLDRIADHPGDQTSLNVKLSKASLRMPFGTHSIVAVLSESVSRSDSDTDSSSDSCVKSLSRFPSGPQLGGVIRPCNKQRLDLGVIETAAFRVVPLADLFLQLVA